MKTVCLRFNLYLGILSLAAGVVMLALGLPFMKIWYYAFARWGLILAVDSVNYRRLKASLLANPKNFIFLAFVSVFFSLPLKFLGSSSSWLPSGRNSGANPGRWRPRRFFSWPSMPSAFL